MKRYKVTGYINVAVTTIVEVEVGEVLTQEEACDRTQKARGGWHRIYEFLQAELLGLDVIDIITQYLIFQKCRELAYRQKLWAAVATMLSSCSDDSFDYFQGWLTVQGRDVYLTPCVTRISLWIQNWVRSGDKGK